MYTVHYLSIGLTFQPSVFLFSRKNLARLISKHVEFPDLKSEKS